jgi:hypothetical protein
MSDNANQRLAKTQRQLAFLKSEMNTATNPLTIRERLISLVECLEYLLFGQLSNGDPNTIPGTPAELLDTPGKQKVEFTSGPAEVMAAQAQARAKATIAARPLFNPNLPALAGPPVVAPSAPVTNGDVQFIKTNPPDAQAVEFYAGPGATSGSNPNGQRVEYVGPNGTPVDENGDPLTAPAPAIPLATLVARAVPAVTAPPPAAEEIAPESHVPGIPQTLEEARAAIPIPLAD